MYQSLQGNAGLGRAIAYFTSCGFPVSIPLNDTQKYDLVVDFNGGLQRVQVKTSRFKRSSGAYEVLLKNCGGASKSRTITLFDKGACDYLFVLTGGGTMYLIPAPAVEGTHAISVGNKYQEYEVQERQLDSFAI